MLVAHGGLQSAGRFTREGVKASTSMHDDPRGQGGLRQCSLQRSTQIASHPEGPCLAPRIVGVVPQPVQEAASVAVQVERETHRAPSPDAVDTPEDGVHMAPTGSAADEQTVSDKAARSLLGREVQDGIKEQSERKADPESRSEDQGDPQEVPHRGNLGQIDHLPASTSAIRLCAPAA